MASASTDPIVIASDDESDNDDVVLVKEEIEVDSEDVIFLSETKPTPKSDTAPCIPTSNSTNSCFDRENSLSRSISLTTCTDQLTLDDDSQLGSSDRLDSSDSLGPAVASSVGPGTCPLDLSSKTVKPHDKDVSSSSGLIAQNDDSQGTTAEQSFFMLLMDDKSNDSLRQTTSGNDLGNGAGMQASVNDGALASSAGTSSITSTRDTDTSSSTRLSLLRCPASSTCDNSFSSSSLSSSDPYSNKPSTSASQKPDDINGIQGVISTSAHTWNVSSAKSKSVDSTVIQTGQGTTNSVSGVVSSSFLSSRIAVKNSAISFSGTLRDQKPSNDLSDPFQTTHALLTSLDLTLTSVSQPQTGSVSSPLDQKSSTCTGSQSGLSVGTSSGQNQPMGASVLDDGQQFLSTLMSPSILGFSPASQSNTYYNSLTLPLSIQNTSKFKMKPDFSTDFKVLPHNHTPVSQTKVVSRSPSPTSTFHLPPKKQRRCYSETQQRANCTNCDVNLIGEKSSQCPNGHVSCTKCLEERVKLILTGRAKESVKCLHKSCDSFYPISELRQSLPSMVVEILEEKLDKDYVDFISDMILKKASEELDLDSTSGNSDLMEYGMEMRYFRKFEDCPGHWEEMDEREVNKNGYALIPLEPESTEYEKVVLRFFESMVDHNVELTAVYRVQNPILWKYYTVKKSEMVRDNEGFNSVVEGQLFHGTSTSAADNICRKGFDWRLCGKHGTMYGQGSYFAVNASYSHQYTDLRRPHGLYRMVPPSVHLSGPQSFVYPPVNVNFGQQPLLNPVIMPSSPVNSHFRPINLSHNAPAPVNQPVGLLQTGSVNVTNFSHNVQSVQNNSNQSSSSSTAGSSSSTVSNNIQPGSSGTSQPWQQIFDDLQKSADKFLAQKKKPCLHSRRVGTMPKPLAIRSISGLASSALVTNMDSPTKPERPRAKVFLARVLVGKYTEGNPKLRKPPPLYPNSDQFGKCYDSCVDNEAVPKIFVIFDSTQAYPEYLLEYTYGADKLTFM